MFSTSSVPCSDLSQTGRVVASKLLKKKHTKLFKRTAEKGEAVPHSHQAPLGFLKANVRGGGGERRGALGDSREYAERKQKGRSTPSSGGHWLEKGRIKEQGCFSITEFST